MSWVYKPIWVEVTGSHGYGYGLAIPNPPKTHTYDTGLTGIMGIAELHDWVMASCNINVKTTKQQQRPPKMMAETRQQEWDRGNGTVRGRQRAEGYKVHSKNTLLFYLLTIWHWQNHNMRGIPLLMLFLLDMRKEGHTPSSPCHCLFDATRRGILPVVFWRSEEGTGPPCHVLLPNSTRQGRVGPPCHIFVPTSTRQGRVSLFHRVIAILMQQGGLGPPHRVFVPISTWKGGISPPCRVIVPILKHKVGIPLLGPQVYENPGTGCPGKPQGSPWHFLLLMHESAKRTWKSSDKLVILWAPKYNKMADFHLFSCSRFPVKSGRTGNLIS